MICERTRKMEDEKPTEMEQSKGKMWRKQEINGLAGQSGSGSVPGWISFFYLTAPLHGHPTDGSSKLPLKIIKFTRYTFDVFGYTENRKECLLDKI